MKRLFLASLAMACLSSAAGAQEGRQAPSQPADPPTAAPNYRDPANWLCRPGRADPCQANLDAVAVAADGSRTPAPFVRAKKPKIDCFYVYPTVSSDPTMYSDLHPDGPEQGAAVSQAARYGAHCRVFAPLYRQTTLAALRWGIAANRSADGAFDRPYDDIRAAWKSYLKHDNKGRGVVLIGHSQGAILLTRLMA